MVGGESMFPTKNIIANAMNPRDHTTLVAAVKAAGLVETLQGAGPFTVFAPTNAAFGKLPSGTVDMLKPLGSFYAFCKTTPGVVLFSHRIASPSISSVSSTKANSAQGSESARCSGALKAPYASATCTQ